MELTLTTPSLLAFRKVDFHKKLALAPGRMRIKQRKSPLRYVTITSKIDELQVQGRRSAQYHPSVWDPKDIESLSTPYTVRLCSMDYNIYIFIYIYKAGL